MYFAAPFHSPFLSDDLITDCHLWLVWLKFEVEINLWMPLGTLLADFYEPEEAHPSQLWHI